MDPQTPVQQSQQPIGVQLPLRDLWVVNPGPLELWGSEPGPVPAHGVCNPSGPHWSTCQLVLGGKDLRLALALSGHCWGQEVFKDCRKDTPCLPWTRLFMLTSPAAPPGTFQEPEAEAANCWESS